GSAPPGPPSPPGSSPALPGICMGTPGAGRWRPPDWRGVRGVASLAPLPDPPVTQASQQRVDGFLEVCGGLLEMDFCHRRANVYTAILHADFHCGSIEWAHVEVKSPRGREVIGRLL